MFIPRTVDCLSRHAPREDVEYLHALARMALTVAVFAAAAVYIARGGRIVKLAPT